MNPETIRMECLRYALESKLRTGEDVVELARMYERYVTGEDAKFVPKASAAEPIIENVGGNNFRLANPEDFGLPANAPTRDPNIYADP